MKDLRHRRNRISGRIFTRNLILHRRNSNRVLSMIEENVAAHCAQEEGRNARNRKKESYRGIEEISPRKPSFLFLLPQSRRWRIGAKVDRTRARFASLYRARLPGQFASSTVYSSCGFIGTTFNQWSYPPSSIPFVIDIENAAVGTDEKIIPSDNPRFY